MQPLVVPYGYHKSLPIDIGNECLVLGGIFMKELMEWIREMDHEERIECIKSFVGWACLFVLIFMLSVLGG